MAGQGLEDGFIACQLALPVLRKNCVHNYKVEFYISANSCILLILNNDSSRV